MASYFCVIVRAYRGLTAGAEDERSTEPFILVGKESRERASRGKALFLLDDDERLWQDIAVVDEIPRDAGEPMLVAIDGKTEAEFPYTIPPGETVRLPAATNNPVRRSK